MYRIALVFSAVNFFAVLAQIQVIPAVLIHEEHSSSEDSYSAVQNIRPTLEYGVPRQKMSSVASSAFSKVPERKKPSGAAAGEAPGKMKHQIVFQSIVNVPMRGIKLKG